MSIVGLDIDRFRASCDFAEVGQCRAVVICVPTPLNKDREPDISNIIATGKAIALHLRKRVLVVLESTTYPGTTDEDLRKVLEEGSGLNAGTDFHLAFSPEREDPGNPDSVVAKSPCHPSLLRVPLSPSHCHRETKLQGCARNSDWSTRRISPS